MPGSMMQPDLQGVAPVQGSRALALARWQERGWPGPKEEAWRFTRLASLDKLSLRPADASLSAGMQDIEAAGMPPATISCMPADKLTSAGRNDNLSSDASRVNRHASSLGPGQPRSCQRASADARKPLTGVTSCKSGCIIDPGIT